MSHQTSQLPEAFEFPSDSGPLDDEETARAADEIFGMLDAEENHAYSR